MAKRNIVPVYRLVGFDCEFLAPPPPNLQTECPVCLQIIREPHQVTCCGKKFCQSCIQTIKSRSNPCPTCNRQEFTYFPDTGHKQLLYELKVHCSHQRKGCQWTEKLRKLDEHLNRDPQPDKTLEGCSLTAINCDFYNVGCTVKLPRLNMAKHLTEAQHQHMSLLVVSHTKLIQKHQKLETAHTKLDNEHAKLTDGHNTLFKNHTKLVEQHVILQGSHVRMKEEHDSLSSSNAQLLINYEELKETCDRLTKSNLDLKKHLSTLDQSRPAATPTSPPDLTRTETIPIQQSSILEMDNFEQYKRDNHWWYSIPLHTHHQGYKFCLGVVANGHGIGHGSHVSAFIFLMSGDYDDYLTWPFRGSISIEMLDHQDKVVSSYLCIYDQHVGTDYCKRVQVGERAKLGWGAPKFIAHKIIRHPTIVRDRIRFRIAGGESRL